MNLLPSSRFRRLALLAAVAGLAWLLLRVFDSDRALLLRQKELIEWAREGAPSDFPDFAAPDYHDQWGHTPLDVAANVRAVRLAHPGLTITDGPRRIERDGDTAVITQHLTVTGTGEHIAHDFHFIWHKESLWPWSWKLREVTAPGLN